MENKMDELSNKSFMRALESIGVLRKKMTIKDKDQLVLDIQSFGFPKEAKFLAQHFNVGRPVDVDKVKESLILSYQEKVARHVSKNVKQDGERLYSSVYDDVSETHYPVLLMSRVPNNFSKFNKELSASGHLLNDKLANLCEQSARMFCHNFMDRDKFALLMREEIKIFERTNEYNREQREKKAMHHKEMEHHKEQNISMGM